MMRFRFARPILFAVLLGLIATCTVLLNSEKAAALPSCFNSANANFKTPAVDFPRTGLAKNASNNCNNVPRTTSATWPDVNGSYVYLSSYYANSDGSPGSTLHTPNASFILYSGTQPTVAQQIRVKVWLCAHATTSVNAVGIVRDTTFIGTGTQTVTFQPSDFLLSNGVYKTTKVVAQIINPLTTDVVCKLTAHALSGQSYVGFSSDADPMSNATNGAPDKYNQNNWQNNRKALLGPTGLGAFALKTDLPTNNDLEYSLSFKPGCTIQNDSTIFLKVYDADANVGSNPPGTINSIGMPKMLVYEYDPSGALTRTINPTGRADFGVASGNDDFVQYPITVRAGYGYSWVFWDIGARNGLQVWMPFDESLSSLNRSCPVVTGSPSCTLSYQVINSVLPNVQPSGRVRVIAKVTNEAATGGSNITASDWPLSIDLISIGAAGVTTNTTYGLNGNNSLTPQQSSNDIIVEQTVNKPPGIYPLLASVRNGATVVNCNGSVPALELSVSNYPYFRAYSGELIAGSGFEQGGVCQTNELAGIRTYLDRTANDPFALVGSGSQLLATAQGSITGFRTSTQNGADNAFPQRRVLANTFPDANSYATAFNSTITAEEDLGGRAGYPMCTADWLADMPAGGAAGGAVSLSTAPAGSSTVQRYNGDTYFTTSGAVSGKYRIYVDGDAYIGPSGDAAIAYNNAGWTNVGNMPSLIIVATGNIYISPRLARFDGVLVANGTLYTCYAEALNAGDPRGNANKDTDVSLMSPNPCLDKRLQINGAVITNKLNLWRLAGTMNQSTPNETFAGSIITAGETIRLTPEFYLSSPAGAVNNPENQFRDYESVNSLPPSF